MSDSTTELFPIMESVRKMTGPGFPVGIPWSIIGLHEKQALRNHDQTLKRLSERGGLSWSEAELILLDRAWDGRVFWLPKDRLAYEQHEKAAAERVRDLLKTARPSPPRGGHE